ncbi:hypothetical protein [Paenibacillus sp. FSL F4-0097]|uniref:hypothetical protein n=1 Tax=Paenibacillus sp. FSL F4-0097 TaxID=2921369 RepID=UPI0031583F5F
MAAAIPSKVKNEEVKTMPRTNCTIDAGHPVEDRCIAKAMASDKQLKEKHLARMYSSVLTGVTNRFSKIPWSLSNSSIPPARIKPRALGSEKVSSTSVFAKYASGITLSPPI